MNINKVSRVKYWGKGGGLAPSAPPSYAYAHVGDYTHVDNAAIHPAGLLWLHRHGLSLTLKP